MMSLVIAALLQAAAPNVAAAKADGLSKDDYERVAWCHGAVAGQLELDPVVKADMEKIEGRAKVAARAKDDAEIERERRKYLKDYERALSAAEKASTTMIHPRGVAAEQQGYRFWAPTRAKEPIWRMLDWGMWDANDAGCGDAAKRLLAKSQLFGAALRNDDKAEVAPEPPTATEAEPARDQVAETVTPRAPSEAPPASPEAPATPAAEQTIVAFEDVKPAAPTPKAKPKPAPKKIATVTPKARAKPPAKISDAEAIRAAIASGKAELEKPADPATAATPPQRGSQQP